MAAKSQLKLILLLLLTCKSIVCEEVKEDQTVTEETKEELVESETKDGKLEIIKRIKKVNEDGSYTIGYEADDGSFKIESRDVLGNIKGTYGFVDDEGKVKRVSYSTSNTTDVLAKIEKPNAPSVVQRIPKTNKTSINNRPNLVFPTTLSPSSTTPNLVQALRRRASSTSATTSKPNYNSVVSIGSSTTNRPIIYTSSPRVLLQRSSLGTTIQPHTGQTSKSNEGQLSRPEISVTDIPIYRKLALKQHEILDETTKPVIEEPEVRSNILRRELSQEKPNGFNPREHVVNLQQSDGDDITDIYSGSLTSAAPRHLYSTTLRPRILSTTIPPLRYSTNYQVESTTPEYAQETSTTQSTVDNVNTPTPVPIVQIPANRGPPQEPLVAIRHPYQRGSSILVPLSHLQRRIVPVDNIPRDDVDQYILQNIRQQEQQYRETTNKPQDQEPRPIAIRRLPPPPLRPIPVQVDENGYIRELGPQAPTPYPLPIPITPVPRYNTPAPVQPNDDMTMNEINEIEPPVSTREFQKLLQHLILRQTKLEKVNSMMTSTTPPRRQYDPYPQPQSPYRPQYRTSNVPYFIQRAAPQQELQHHQNGPVRFMQEQDPNDRNDHYIAIPRNRALSVRQQDYQDQYANAQSYVPMRRVARLLPSETEVSREEYLPPDVREMLLLRMLQLAINPNLPVEEDEVATGTTPTPQFKRSPVRNVEILGEESEEMRRPARNKSEEQASSTTSSTTTAAAFVAPAQAAQEIYYNNGGIWLKPTLSIIFIITQII